MVTEIKLLINKGVVTEERPVAYVYGNPKVIAAHLFSYFFISYVDDIELFPMSSVNFYYALKIVPYYGEVPHLTELINLYNHEGLAKAKGSQNDKYIQEYNTILHNLVKNEQQFKDEAKLAADLGNASNVNLINMENVWYRKYANKHLTVKSLLRISETEIAKLDRVSKLAILTATDSVAYLLSHNTESIETILDNILEGEKNHANN